MHFLRNVLAQVPRGSAEMVAAAVLTVFAQPDAEHIDEHVWPPRSRGIADAEEQRKRWLTMSLESRPTENASIGELMTQLSSQTSRLVRDELRLAQKEFQEAAKHAGIGAGLLSVAGLLAFFGFATVIAAGVAALSLALPVWAAALIVAALLFMAAGAAALVSKKQVDEVSPPRQTVGNVKKDINEVKDARHDRT